MRRWITVLLLLFVPLQFSWAAVSAYCRHETGTQSHHVGHHEHEHKAAKDGTDDHKAKNGIDPDCGPCHAGCAVSLCGRMALPSADHSLELAACFTGKLAAAPPARPERPKWAALA